MLIELRNLILQKLNTNTMYGGFRMEFPSERCLKYVGPLGVFQKVFPCNITDSPYIVQYLETEKKIPANNDKIPSPDPTSKTVLPLNKSGFRVMAR